ncbi:hypothetical protein Hte_011441 [Hypoxylon texense]
MEYFYPIFKDMQNWMNTDYKDQFPQLPFTDKPKGPHAANEYRKKLVEWPTFRFYNTRLSNKIEHGFHALALDETRGPFIPTLWEREPENQDSSDLRQVWFPGSHGNIGGGWDDQGMMDQLASVGCEFRNDALEKLHDHNVQFYKSLKQKKHDKRVKACCGCCGALQKEHLPWAAPPIFEPNKPVRPWSLHSIQSVSSPLYNLAGSVTRSPGMYKKINPDNGRRLHAFLDDTNERIHSSVRVRLACEGLGLNDSKVWECPALLKMWRPRRIYDKFLDPIPQNANWGPKGENNRGIQADGTTNTAREADSANVNFSNGSRSETAQGNNGLGQLRWVWEYIGPDVGAPFVRTLVEENMGPWERHLLGLSTGKLHVYNYAEAQDISKVKAFGGKVAKKSKLKKSEKPSKSSPKK